MYLSLMTWLLMGLGCNPMQWMEGTLKKIPPMAAAAEML